MEKSEILQAAKLKGWKVSRVDQGGQFEKIGVEIREFSWSWFNVWPDGYCSYCHTYSQNTGKTCKNFRRGMKKMDKIFSVLDANKSK